MDVIQITVQTWNFKYRSKYNIDDCLPNHSKYKIIKNASTYKLLNTGFAGKRSKG